MLAEVPQVRDANGTTELYAKFAGIRVTTDGKMLVDGEVVGWKNYTKNVLRLDEFEMRSPVTLLAKRVI